MSEKAHILGLAGVGAIAAACHAANAAFCRFLGDDSQPAWDDAPDWQKASAIDGVSFHLANPDAGDDASHNNWMKLKTSEGWQYGETKDPEKKLHPCMVPFDQLPKEQQFKDTLFRTIVHAMAPPLAARESELEALVRERGALSVANQALADKLAEKISQLAKERGKSRALAAAMPAKPRRFKELADRFEPVQLLELIEAAGEVAIAFLDAKGKELQGVAPARIEGGAGAFRRSGARLLLQLPSLPLTSPTQQDLAAYCLLLDGEVAAYAKRSGPLGLPPSTTYELKDDVVF